MAQMEKKFQKLVAIEPVSLIPSAQEELKQYADQVILYEDIPADEEEIVRRIGDAEFILGEVINKKCCYILTVCFQVENTLFFHAH